MIPFPATDTYKRLIELAYEEDMGTGRDDVTSRLSVPAGITATGVLVQKQGGVVCGLPIVQEITAIYDPEIQIRTSWQEIKSIEGRFNDRTPVSVLELQGSLRSLLAAERVILNFVQRMSGVATLANQFVQKVQGTGAQIVDTRKTIPGFRSLDKYAVAAGGAFNHRIGLFDMLLVKDNHLSVYPLKDLKQAVTDIIRKSRAENSARPIEIEVDTLDQLREIINVSGIDFILLDNMDCQTLRTAVAMRDEAGKRGCLALEASGGVNLDTVRDIALTGVDRISVGAITHSAPALDIGLDIVC